MSIPARWVCPSCGSNNMLQSSVCFRCKAPQPAAALPTLQMPAAGRRSGIPIGAMVAVAGFCLLLAVSNPPKETFIAWIKGQIVAREKPSAELGSVIAMGMVGPILDSYTSVNNCVLFSIFTMRGSDGSLTCRAVGALGQIIPLHLKFHTPPSQAQPLPAPAPDSFGSPPPGLNDGSLGPSGYDQTPRDFMDLPVKSRSHMAGPDSRPPLNPDSSPLPRTGFSGGMGGGMGGLRAAPTPTPDPAQDAIPPRLDPNRRF